MIIGDNQRYSSNNALRDVGVVFSHHLKRLSTIGRRHRKDRVRNVFSITHATAKITANKL